MTGSSESPATDVAAPTSVPGARWRWRPAFYGWYIAWAGAATNLLVLGVTSFGFSVFVAPLREELGWSVAAITFGFSLRSFQGGLLGPFMGAVVDRFGPRACNVAGILIVGAGLALFASAHELWVYYASSVIIALGQSLGGFVAFSTALVYWFERMRGRAMGVLAMGNGAAYLLTPVLALLIEAYSWRVTLLIAAAVVVAAGVPLSLVLRDRPEPYGLRADGAVAAAGTPRVTPVATGMSVRKALHTPAFYLLVVAVSVGTPTQTTWIVLQVPALRSVGYSIEAAALLAGAYGAVQIGLRFIAGWVADRFGRRAVYGASFVLQGAGLALFAGMDASRPWLAPLFLVTYALGHGLFVVLFMTITADYFGTRHFATLRGLTMLAQTPLAVLAPLFAGWTFDHWGSYRPVFLGFAVVVAIGALPSRSSGGRCGTCSPHRRPLRCRRANRRTARRSRPAHASGG